MNTRLLIMFLVALIAPTAQSASSINSTSKFAYGANLGWMDWRGDTNNGAVLGEYVCSGYIWAANVGWIHLGSNNPANSIQYQNNSATDYGVNHDGQGNLRGFAYGANIGWVNFESNGAPKVDLKTGRLSGYVYSANCGWISLSNSFAQVQTDTIAPGATGTNGLPLAWMLTYFGTTNVNASADPDGDGMSNKQEYLAGTNPTNSLSNLRITALNDAAGGGTNVSLSWSSVPIRCYLIQESTDLNSPSWPDSGLGLVASGGSFTTRSVVGTNAPIRFYRVQAVRPLAP